MRRWYFLTLALVGVALGLLSPAPAYASTYIGDQTDKREAAANYLGYGWQEQSIELKNELGTTDDSWDYDRWQAWLNSISRDWSNSYWVTNYEGFMLVDAKDKAKADFERALSRVNASGDSGQSGDSGTTEQTDPYAGYLTINTYFLVDDKTPKQGVVKIGPSVINYMQGLCDSQGYNYFILGMDNAPVKGNGMTGYDGHWHCYFTVCGFKSRPTIVNNGSRYVSDVGGSFSKKAYNSGTYFDCVASGVDDSLGARSVSNFRAVTDIIEFKSATPVSPTPQVVVSGNTVINVYEGDTSNITANIDNSSSTVENSTTIYDTENNTYTTVNYITTNNTVDVSAITQRLDVINAKVGQIGTDLNSLFGELNQNLSALFLGIGTTISDGVTTLRNQLVQVVAWLQVLDSDLRGIDKSVKAIPSSSGTVVVSTSGGGGSGGSANADVDLSTIESDLDDIKAKLDALLVINGVDAAANVLQTLFDLLSGIMDAVGEKLGAIGSALSGLTEVFPFSIPWDVAAMAALFAADPVTPVFDVPLPAPNGGTQNFHVDLSALDPVASVFRSGEMVLFALGLALRTRDMMGGGDDIA